MVLVRGGGLCGDGGEVVVMVSTMVLKTKSVNELIWHSILDFYRFLTHFGRLLIDYGRLYWSGSVVGSRLNRPVRSRF